MSQARNPATNRAMNWAMNRAIGRISLAQRSLARLAAAALFALITQAGSINAQTLIDESSPALRARVVLDPAASVEPGLAGFLREEAEATVALYRDIAREDAAAAQASGASFARYSVEITDRVTLLTPDYASVLRRIAITADAGPVVLVEALTTDRRSGAFLRLDAFLGGPDGRAALRALASHLTREIVARYHGGAPTPDWTREIRAATRPDLAVLQNFTLAAAPTDRDLIGAFSFHFAPGVVAPPSAGPVDIAVPINILRAGLKPELAARVLPP
ncbi:MAG: RsiV family protein [Pseudomonadota bacterium]